jgi:hypothetical protein
LIEWKVPELEPKSVVPLLFWMSKKVGKKLTGGDS